MASFTGVQNTVSQKLAIVCALAMAAGVFADDDIPAQQQFSESLGCYAVTPDNTDAEALAQIPGLIAFNEKINVMFDLAYTQILAGQVPENRLHQHPFATAREIFSRALAEIKDMRGTGELGPHGDRLITVLAESRYKADRNANLIRQIMVEPKPYVSSIDRDGLVALARLGRESAGPSSS